MNGIIYSVGNCRIHIIQVGFNSVCIETLNELKAKGYHVRLDYENKIAELIKKI